MDEAFNAQINSTQDGDITFDEKFFDNELEMEALRQTPAYKAMHEAILDWGAQVTQSTKDLIDDANRKWGILLEQAAAEIRSPITPRASRDSFAVDEIDLSSPAAADDLLSKNIFAATAAAAAAVANTARNTGKKSVNSEEEGSPNSRRSREEQKMPLGSLAGSSNASEAGEGLGPTNIDGVRQFDSLSGGAANKNNGNEI